MPVKSACGLCSLVQTVGFTEAKGSPAPSLAPNTEEIPDSLDPQRPLHLATCFLQIPFLAQLRALLGMFMAAVILQSRAAWSHGRLC